MTTFDVKLKFSIDSLLFRSFVYSVNIINDAIIAEISTCPMAKRMQIIPQSIIKLKFGSKVETKSANQIISKTLWDRLSRVF